MIPRKPRRKYDFGNSQSADLNRSETLKVEDQLRVMNFNSNRGINKDLRTKGEEKSFWINPNYIS